MDNSKLNKITSLDIKVMSCRSGQGLQYYVYEFLQIGGSIHSSGDVIGSHHYWDGNFDKVPQPILDCRNHKCVEISKDELKKILENG